MPSNARCVVRRANEQDLPAALRMAESFYATTDYPKVAAFSAVDVASIGPLLLSNGVMLVAERAGQIVGMVGLVLAPFLFNKSVTTAHEVVWWVDPDARDSGAGVALLRAIEPACKDSGAVMIQMLHLANSPPQAAALYQRFGYVYAEASYMKVL